MSMNYFPSGVPPRLNDAQITRLAIAKTNQDVDEKSFQRNSKILNAAFYASWGAPMVLSEGIAKGGLRLSSYLLPLGIINLADDILAKKNQDYANFKKESPVLHLLAIFIPALSSSYFLDKHLISSGWYDKAKNKINTTMKKAGEKIKSSGLYKKMPEGLKDFCKNTKDTISKGVTKAKGSKGFLTVLNLLPWLFLGVKWVRENAHNQKKSEIFAQNFQTIKNINDKIII